MDDVLNIQDVADGAASNARGFDIGRVLVLGLGKSGKSVARYCADLLGSRVESLFIAAGAQTPDSVAFVESLAPQGVSYAFGDEALESFDALSRPFDICIASPGIPCWHELYVCGERLSGELISEVEFAWRESKPDSIWIAITGTNGKTTTTSCCAHVLRACGFAADAVGNIGDVCLDAVAAGNTQVYVAEVSSYQLYSTRYFAPDVAVMLNITPDHLHWHQTLEAYRDAKFKMLDNMTARARTASSATSGPIMPVAILDASNDVVRSKVRELKVLSREQRGFSYVPMGTADGISGDMRERCGAENAAFISGDGRLRVAFGGVEHVLASCDDLLIKGEHNASNALAVGAVAVVLGADDAQIADALATFAPLEHRIEPCGDVRGVACYNDSKATNVDATVKALTAFPDKRLIVLLGGDDKGTGLDELVAAVHKHAAVAVCFGAAGPRFARALEGALDALKASEPRCRVEHAQNMTGALDCALSCAREGDVILLSPACASFDEFKSFEHRGSVFKQLVKERAGEVSGAQGE